MDGPLWLRILSACSQTKCHPLQHPSIARLLPHYSPLRRWTYRHNIERPNQILQQLGVDIFRDLLYDTWVLQQVSIRLITNQHSHTTKDGRRYRSLNPLYSFLNHSCEPNACWDFAKVGQGATAHESTALRVTARKPIKKGEEITISYGDNDQGGFEFSKKAVRQEQLLNWLPNGRCECSLCQQQEDHESKPGGPPKPQGFFIQPGQNNDDTMNYAYSIMNQGRKYAGLPLFEMPSSK